MVATGSDDQRIAIDPVDETIEFIDAARPEAREFFLQGFGFSDAIEWLPQTGLNQVVDPFERLAILTWLILIVFLGFQGPGQAQWINRHPLTPAAPPAPDGTAQWSERRRPCQRANTA